MLNKLLHLFAKAYWFIFRPKTFGVKVVVHNNGEILMIKNSYGRWNKWMFPGGGINKNEDSEEAAKREVLEEVGVRLTDVRKIGGYTSDREYKKDTVSVFLGESSDKDFKIDKKEIAEAQWFSVSNLPEISDYSKNILLMWQHD